MGWVTSFLPKPVLLMYELKKKPDLTGFGGRQKFLSL
jgi:hypothetical protein